MANQTIKKVVPCNQEFVDKIEKAGLEIGIKQWTVALKHFAEMGVNSVQTSKAIKP